jgi:hypothetical protein
MQRTVARDPRPRRLRLVGIAAALLALGAGCGGVAPTPTGSGPAATSPAPASEDPEAVFRAFTGALNAGDAETATSLLADGATIYDMVVGEESAESVISNLPCTTEVVSADRSGDTIDVELRFTGTNPARQDSASNSGSETWWSPWRTARSSTCRSSGTRAKVVAQTPPAWAIGSDIEVKETLPGSDQRRG